MEVIVGGGADGVVEAAHEVAKTRTKGDGEDLLFTESVRSQDLDVILGDTRGTERDDFGVLAHRNFPVGQTGIPEIRFDRDDLLCGTEVSGEGTTVDK